MISDSLTLQATAIPLFIFCESLQRNKASTKALGKCSPWLVWQQSTREALKVTIQWYQEVSHVLALIPFFFCVLPVEADGQLSPHSVASEGQRRPQSMLAYGRISSVTSYSAEY